MAFSESSNLTCKTGRELHGIFRKSESDMQNRAGITWHFQKVRIWHAIAGGDYMALSDNPNLTCKSRRELHGIFRKSESDMQSRAGITWHFQKVRI